MNLVLYLYLQRLLRGELTASGEPAAEGEVAGLDPGLPQQLREVPGLPPQLREVPDLHVAAGDVEGHDPGTTPPQLREVPGLPPQIREVPELHAAAGHVAGHDPGLPSQPLDVPEPNAGDRDGRLHRAQRGDSHQ